MARALQGQGRAHCDSIHRDRSESNERDGALMRKIILGAARQFKNASTCRGMVRVKRREAAASATIQSGS